MSDNVRRLWMKDGGVVELVAGGERVTLLVQNHDGDRAATVLRADEAGQVLVAIAELLPQGGENSAPGVELAKKPQYHPVLEGMACVVPAKKREPVGEEPQRLPGEPSMVYRGRLMYWHLDESDDPYEHLDSVTRHRWTMLASGMERLMEKAPRIDLGSGSERP